MGKRDDPAPSGHRSPEARPSIDQQPFLIPYPFKVTSPLPCQDESPYAGCYPIENWENPATTLVPSNVAESEMLSQYRLAEDDFKSLSRMISRQRIHSLLSSSSGHQSPVDLVEWPTFPTTFMVYTSTKRTLPSEVWDSIIDEVGDDPPHLAASFSALLSYHQNLLACALTCRSWRPRSYLHQFNHVHLAYSNHKQFIRACQTLPWIQYRVQHLNVWGDDKGTIILHRLATSLSLHSMMQLSQLTLQHFTTFRELPGFRKTISQFCRVDTLVLCDVAATYIETLFFLMASFPNTTTTVVTSLEGDSPKFQSRGPFYPSDQIPSLRTVLGAPGWLRLYYDLRVGWTSPTLFTPNHFLTLCDSIVTDAHISLRSNLFGDYRNVTSLRSSGRLRTLILADIYGEDVYLALVDALYSVVSRRLQYLRLEIWPGGLTKWCVNNDDWQSLSRILAQDKFISLKKVVIRFMTNSQRPILKANHKSLLPNLAKRGIVTYEEYCVRHPMHADQDGPILSVKRK